MSDFSPVQSSPTTAGSWILLVAQTIDSYGLDSEYLFKQNGISLSQIKKDDIRYPSGLLARVWQMAVGLTQDPYLAIRVSRYFKPSAFGALGLTMAASSTVYDALNRFERFSAFISGGTQVKLTENNGDICLKLAPHQQSEEHWNIYALSATFSSLYSLLSQVAGGHPGVKSVHFKQGFASSLAFESFFGCPVIYHSSFNGIVFNKHEVLIKHHGYHPALTSSLDSWIESQLSKLNENSISKKVKNIYLKNFRQSELSQQVIARHLAMSTRKLQRKLSEEGTSYSELVNDCRKNIAIKLILHKAMSLCEISIFLGYKCQSNFTRAFKRWTGTTPNQYP